MMGCYAPGELGSLLGLRSFILDSDLEPMKGCYAPGNRDPSQVSEHSPEKVPRTGTQFCQFLSLGLITTISGLRSL
jgi:hypothetical protein